MKYIVTFQVTKGPCPQVNEVAINALFCVVVTFHMVTCHVEICHMVISQMACPPMLSCLGFPDWVNFGSDWPQKKHMFDLAPWKIANGMSKNYFFLKKMTIFCN